MSKKMHTVSWVLDSIKSNQFEIKSEEDLAFFYNLSPFSESLFGPSNPVLLFGGANLELIKDKVTTVRDGLIPFSYFLRSVNAQSLQGMMYVPIEYWFLVTQDWTKKVKFYETVSDKMYDKENVPKKIIIMGSFNTFMSDEKDFFEEEIIHLVKSLGGHKVVDKIDIAVYFSCKAEGVNNNLLDDRILNYSHKLFKHLKIDISFPTLENILSETNYQDVLNYEINNKKYIAETYTKNYILSRGGGLLRTEKKYPDLELSSSARLSPFHSINVYSLTSELKKNPDIIENPEYYHAYLKFFKTNSKINSIETWWDKWFTNYVKRNYLNYEGNN